jgi:flavin-dependent dehydrogenase
MKPGGGLSLENAGARRWDVAVVGAGPAGSFAAYELARRGAAVLLVDKAPFPRWKVCGACINGRALSILRQSGLESLVARRGAVRLFRFRVYAGRRAADVPLPEGAALSREALDSALVEAAVVAGCAFLPETNATLGAATAQARTLFLQQRSGSYQIAASVVLAADGLAGSLLAQELRHQMHIRPNSWIGAGTVARDGPGSYSPGTIFMGCGREGYLGLVRVEDGRLNIAAAMSPDGIKRGGGPGRAAMAILSQAGLPDFPGLERLPWRGTPALTRRVARVASHRLFVLGDAAGYVEPFTGEGIAWALASGRAVAPLAMQAVSNWRPGLAAEWCALHERTVGRRQGICSALTAALRHRLFCRAMVFALARAPALAHAVARHLNQ